MKLVTSRDRSVAGGEENARYLDLLRGLMVHDLLVYVDSLFL